MDLNLKKIPFFWVFFFFLASLLIIVKLEPFLKFGYLGIFLFNIIGAGSLLVFGLAGHMNIVGVALATALGLAINDSVAWLIGRNSDVLIPRSKSIRNIKHILHKFGVVALFILSFIPFPYDLVGLIAGYLEFPYLVYFIPTFLGKYLRTLLIGIGIVSFFA